MAGLGIVLAVIGAILYFAVDASISGLEISTVGVILMVAGGIALLVGLLQMAQSNRGGSPGGGDPNQM